MLYFIGRCDPNYFHFLKTNNNNICFVSLIFNKFEYFCVIFFVSDSVLYSLLVFSPVSHSSFFPLVVVIILQSICFLHCFMCHFLAIFYIGIIIIASVFFSFSCLHRLLQTAMHCSSNNSYPSHLMTRKRNGLSTKKHSHTKKNV